MSIRPGVVPKPLGPLLGRADDIAAVEHLLETSRLVSLTGIGGSGKTRLAIEVARRAKDRGSNVVFVDLAPLSDAALVADALARALGLAEASEEPPEARVVGALSDLEILLVLDNLEHLLACRSFLGRLLAEAGGVRLIATSRVPLRIEGECEYPVTGLALPAGLSAAEVAEAPACSLFVARAAEVGVDLEGPGYVASVAALCRRLDGLPLAIELAARRTRALTPQEILSRLTTSQTLLFDAGRPARQSSVDEVISWSVGLLTESERRLFRTLGVFAGGFDLDAVGAIADVPDLLAALERLIELGLVLRAEATSGPARYTLLESIRVFAMGELQASGDAKSVRQRHVAYFCALAQQGENAQHEPTSGDWQRRLVGEVDNVRAAFDEAIALGEAGSAPGNRGRQR